MLTLKLYWVFCSLCLGEALYGWPTNCWVRKLEEVLASDCMSVLGVVGSSVVSSKSESYIIIVFSGSYVMHVYVDQSVSGYLSVYICMCCVMLKITQRNLACSR